MKLNREQRSTLFIICIFLGGTALNLCASDELWHRNFSAEGLLTAAARRKSTAIAIKAPLPPVVDCCPLGTVQVCDAARINALIAERYAMSSRTFGKKYGTYRAKIFIGEKVSRSFFEGTKRYLSFDSFVKQVLGVCGPTCSPEQRFSPLRTIINNNGIDTVYLPIVVDASGKTSLDTTAHCILVETKFDSTLQRMPASTKELCDGLFNQSIKKILSSVIEKLNRAIRSDSSAEQTDCAQHAIGQFTLFAQALACANVLHAATVVDTNGAVHLYLLTNHGQAPLKDSSVDAVTAELCGRLPGLGLSSKK
ncbi:MAG: hypothetical protein QG604_760 [Candidatus Dependentiae bacterium]|nr:hypothetical protein [Candidatus Dependentiae bacterium]